MADPTNELPAKSEERDTKTPERSREWEPFQNLRREIDRVFENFHHGLSAFGRTRMEFEPFRLLAGGWGSTPAITMIEKENAYELTAELPGMDESNVELKVAGGVLTDLLPNLPPLIKRVCSGYAPDRGVLRTQSV